MEFIGKRHEFLKLFWSFGCISEFLWNIMNLMDFYHIPLSFQSIPITSCTSFWNFLCEGFFHFDYFYFNWWLEKLKFLTIHSIIFVFSLIPKLNTFHYLVLNIYFYYRALFYQNYFSRCAKNGFFSNDNALLVFEWVIMEERVWEFGTSGKKKNKNTSVS